MVLVQPDQKPLRPLRPNQRYMHNMKWSRGNWQFIFLGEFQSTVRANLTKKLFMGSFGY